jgi:hypothetical protein
MERLERRWLVSTFGKKFENVRIPYCMYLNFAKRRKKIFMAQYLSILFDSDPHDS